MHFVTNKNYSTFFGIFVLTLLVYSYTQLKNPTPYDYFIRLSDSFIHGKVYLTDHPAWLNELIPTSDPNKYYVAYPPMPAIIATPFVVLNIANKSQTFIAVLFGSINAAALYLVLKRLYSYRTSVLGALLLAFGTNHWYLATEGSSWYIAHIIAVFFQLMAFLLIFKKSEDEKLVFATTHWRWLTAGLCIGAAYWSRLPAVLIAPFFGLIPLAQQELKKYLKSLLLFGFGVSFFILLNFGYNYIRFSTISDQSYVLIPGVLEEPWFNKGIFSVSYLPKNIQFFFAKTPTPYASFPYFKPSMEGMSFFLTSPFFILLPFINWKKRYNIIALAIGILMLGPGLLHGTPGFAQFGYRFAMEATPLFIIAFCSFLERKWWLISVPLMILAVAVNFWGIYFIRVLNIY